MEPRIRGLLAITQIKFVLQHILSGPQRKKLGSEFYYMNIGSFRVLLYKEKGKDKTRKRKCWVIEQKGPSCIDNGSHFIDALHRPSKTV